MSARVSRAAMLVAIALLASCAPPPVLTPLRIADRGPAPLARTVELGWDPALRFEQKRLESEENPVFVSGDRQDVALRPNGFLAFAFTDALTWVIPGSVLWSPLRNPECGQWLTLGGGLYGLGINGDEVAVDSAIGVWAKRRFGSALWGTAGLAIAHSYASDGWYEDYEGKLHYLALIPGLEGGVQLSDRWAVRVLADYELERIGNRAAQARFRTELVFVATWGLDLGVHGGISLHEREALHVDPLVGVSIVGRW